MSPFESHRVGLTRIGVMATPHISADTDAFADTILLPVDPLRAKWIATNFLDDAVEVTAVRGMLGYTGTFKGKPISVMGTGMGVPSISIYASELIDVYGVEKLIRVGSCGSIQPHITVNEVIIAIGACTDSGVNRARFEGNDFAATADFGLARLVVEAAEAQGRNVHVGNVMTSDLFYGPTNVPLADMAAPLSRMGVLAVEMEVAGLYGVAHERGAKALGVCTVSDDLLTGADLTAEERQETLSAMIEITLGAIA